MFGYISALLQSYDVNCLVASMADGFFDFDTGFPNEHVVSVFSFSAFDIYFKFLFLRIIILKIKRFCVLSVENCLL